MEQLCHWRLECVETIAPRQADVLFNIDVLCDDSDEFVILNYSLISVSGLVCFFFAFFCFDH